MTVSRHALDRYRERVNPSASNQTIRRHLTEAVRCRRSHHVSGGREVILSDILPNPIVYVDKTIVTVLPQ